MPCSILIYSDLVAYILMLTLLQNSPKCYLYYDINIIQIDLVFVEVYSIHFGHVMFEQGPEPEA